MDEVPSFVILWDDGLPMSGKKHLSGSSACTTGCCGWEGGVYAGFYPMKCECGGLVHVEAPSFAGIDSPDWHLTAQCDRCKSHVYVDSLL